MMHPNLKRSLLVIYLIGFIVACSGNRTLDLVRGINDVSDAAISANKLPAPSNLNDSYTARILTINKQLLDIIEANPSGYKEQAITIIKNAREALPLPVDERITGWLKVLEDLVNGVK